MDANIMFSLLSVQTFKITSMAFQLLRESNWVTVYWKQTPPSGIVYFPLLKEAREARSLGLFFFKIWTLYFVERTQSKHTPTWIVGSSLTFARKIGNIEEIIIILTGNLKIKVCSHLGINGRGFPQLSGHWNRTTAFNVFSVLANDLSKSDISAFRVCISPSSLTSAPCRFWYGSVCS